MHHTPLIATIVAGLGLAFIFGALAHRLRVPPLVGYLLAGILVGPHTPGFVADQSLAPELAEIGVILLMFGVGLHFSLKDLLSVKAIAVPGAVAQIGFATALGVGLALLLGWTWGAGIVFGLALSVASTVVLLRALQEKRLVETERGRIAVGWLIVEDLVMVLTLVLLPAVAGPMGGKQEAAADVTVAGFGLGLEGLGIGGLVALTLGKVAAFVIVMLVVGRRVIPWILHWVAHTGSRELFRLAVLALALGVAFGAAELFGVSLALGAFFAGMILSESELSHQAAQESLPLRDAFAVLFFVSVGMLFNPVSVMENPLPVLATLLIIVVGKSIVAFLIVLAFRHPVGTALTISASLAQIGEFSFILAGLGVAFGLLPEQGRDLILAGAILSILLNPLAFKAAERVAARLEAIPGLAEVAAPDKVPEAIVPTSLSGHTILVGYGRVGSIVGEGLRTQGSAFLVIEDSERILARLKETGAEFIAGNAADPEILAAANMPRAACLIVAIPNAFEAGQVIQQARAVNPALRILARAHSDAEVEHLAAMGADLVVMGERQIALGLLAGLHPRPEASAAPA